MILEEPCYWCGRTTMRDGWDAWAKEMQPLRASREHLEPRALGGGGVDRTTLPWAHALCNSQRGHDLTWVPWADHGGDSSLMPAHQWKAMTRHPMTTPEQAVLS